MKLSDTYEYFGIFELEGSTFQKETTYFFKLFAKYNEPCLFQ